MFPADQNNLVTQADINLANSALLGNHQPMTVQTVIQNYAAQNKGPSQTPAPIKPNYANRTFQLVEGIVDPEAGMPVKYTLDDEERRRHHSGNSQVGLNNKSKKEEVKSENSNLYNQNLILQADGSHILYQTDPVSGMPTPIHIPAGADLAAFGIPTPANTEGNPSSSNHSKKQVEDCYDRVFIWDLDETLILLHSLTNGTYANRFGQNQHIAFNLGSRVEEVVLQFAEMNLFWRDLDDCDQVHIDDIQAEENSQLGLNPDGTPKINPNIDNEADGNVIVDNAGNNNTDLQNQIAASLAMAENSGQNEENLAAAALQAQQVALSAAMAAATPISTAATNQNASIAAALNQANAVAGLPNINTNTLNNGINALLPANLNPGQAAANEWMRKMSFRYNRIKEVYDCYKEDPHSLLLPQVRETLDKNHSDINILTENWMNVAYSCLEMISKRPKNKNVIVSSSQLIHTLSKLLVHKISKFFDIGVGF